MPIPCSLIETISFLIQITILTNTQAKPSIFQSFIVNLIAHFGGINLACETRLSLSLSHALDWLNQNQTMLKIDDFVSVVCLKRTVFSERCRQTLSVHRASVTESATTALYVLLPTSVLGQINWVYGGGKHALPIGKSYGFL